MTIGDQPAFPVPIDNNGEALKTPVAWGMTYRQWLVGQIAGWTYAEMMKIDLEKNPGINLEGSVAMMAIEVSDAIIKRMESNE